MKCLDDNTIVELLEGLLAAELRSNVEDHLDACGDCRALLATMAAESAGVPDEATAQTRLSPSPDSNEGAAAAARHDSATMFAPGDSIDHYRVMRMLGRGGMGEVYLARDRNLGRKVALKVIRRRLVASERAVQRFRVEARATAKFSHPNIVTIHAVGDWQGTPYVALEYVQGRTLGALIEESTPSRAHALRIGESIANALAEAHRHGVLHRDLKPANVLLGEDGRVRVLDFGLAKFVQSEMTLSLDTFDGTIATPLADSRAGGTPFFMAPEQWREQECTAATDVWSLGVLLFMMVTGKRPYQASDFATLGEKVCGATPAPRADAIDPDVSAELADLVEQCMRNDPAARPTARGVAESLRNLLREQRRSRRDEDTPFRGLLPFRERHADLFHGREPEIASLVERVRAEPLLAVVGPAGSGKSSFVHAGVLPRLREQRQWYTLVLRPGSRPFRQLAARLRRRDHDGESSSLSHSSDVDTEGVRDLAGELERSPHALALRLRAIADERDCHVLLVVDQLEELFTLGCDEKRRRAFLRAICAAADDAMDPVRVILTVRDDYLARVARDPEVRSALTGVVVFSPPDRAALRELLTRPVELVGYRYDDEELVNDIVEAVADEPAGLTMLGFTAQLLWERRDRDARMLRRTTYNELGGVEGALARHADGVLQSLSRGERQLARRLLLHLVTPEGERASVPRDDTLAGLAPEANHVLQELTAARLVSVTVPEQPGDEDDVVLELAHGALITAWGTLAAWIDESREDVALSTELRRAAATWRRHGHDPERLWTGQALSDAIEVRDRGDHPFDELSVRFLRTSQSRSRRRRRVRTISLVALVTSLATVAVVLAIQKSESELLRGQAEERAAEVRKRRAEALREGASAALAQQNMTEARAKLRVALEIEDSAAARALWWRIQRTPQWWKRSLGGIVYDATMSPDGTHLAAASSDEGVHLYEVDTQKKRVLRGHQDQVFSVDFSADGKWLASSSWSGEVRVWDGATGELVRKVGKHEAGVWSVRFSPNGQLLASASRDGEIRLWRTDDWSLAHAIGGHGSAVWNVAFSPDGTHLASASEDRSARIWSTDTGKEERRLADHTAALRAVAWSRSGKQLATGGLGRSIRLWDSTTGELIREIAAHQGPIRSLQFGPGDRTVVSASRDKTVAVWDTGTGKRLREMRGHDAAVYMARFTPDGERLVTASRDRSVRIWRASGPTNASPPGHDGGVRAARFSPNGQHLATASLDSSVRIWDVADGSVVRVLEGHTAGVWGLAYRPDGAWLASASNDRTIRIWDAKTGRQLRVFAGHSQEAVAVAFSPDGRRLASSSVDATVRLWNPDDGAQLATLGGHGDAAWGVAYSPDGRQLASASADRAVRLWDGANGDALETLEGHTATVYGVAFSPSGDTLYSSSEDHTVRAWPLRGSSKQRRIVTTLPSRGYWMSAAPSGTQLGVSSADGIVRLIDVPSGQVAALRGHSDEVNDVSFSSDGRYAASTSDDQTVRVWDVARRRPYWRAPALIDAPVRLLSHRGWTVLDDTVTMAPRSGWATALEDRAAGSEISGELLCLRTWNGGVELWDRATDQRLSQRHTLAATQVAAFRNGCAVRSLAAVVLLLRDGASITLDLANPTALATSDDRVLVIADGRLLVFDEAGAPQETHDVGSGASAVGRVDGRYAIGYHDGDIALVEDGTASSVAFEQLPSGAPVRIIEGPSGTLVAGYASGAVAMWFLDTRASLAQRRLHGPVVHLTMIGDTIYAATELGEHLAWDLSVLGEDYCKLMADLWSQVPIVWEAGQPVRAARPAGHPCKK